MHTHNIDTKEHMIVDIKSFLVRTFELLEFIKVAIQHI